MNPLFSKPSLMILESLSFTKTLYAFDFDGTLSKIVRTPSEASMTKTTEKLLARLAQYAPVAIVSGRGLTDLKKRVKVPVQYLIGNHGLEGLGDREETLDKAVQACRSWHQSLEKEDFGSGVQVEDKTYSIAIHYRASRNKKKAKAQIQEAISRLSPAPRIIPGKQVVNLLPEGAPHKGVALLELLRSAGLRQAFYIGDDDTDEDVFGLPGDRIMSTRVGIKRNSRARFFIRQQSEINHLLELLLEYYHRNETPAEDPHGTS